MRRFSTEQFALTTFLVFWSGLVPSVFAQEPIRPLPNEMAALKRCYAMAMRLSEKWARTLSHWPQVVNQLVVAAPDRFEPFLAHTQHS